MSETERAGTPRQDRTGRLLAGRYRLETVLGRGGMGTVWRAEDETLGRKVAVKELRFPANIDEEEKRRLITRTLREAKAIARIRNTSAVTVYDVVDEDDRPWIVMEIVDGKSLAEVIREDGTLHPRRAAEVGLAVLDVLRSAHREGILHRDVKPSNVLMAEDGRVVLTDFGIAQIEGDPSLTSTGMLVGAPSYISPERARGHKPGPAADLWSLGGLLYAAVEGVPPYDKGSAIATLTAVMTEPVEEPRHAGPLREVILGLLEKDPDKRLDDAKARALLGAVLSGTAAEAESTPVDPVRTVPLPEERKGSAALPLTGTTPRPTPAPDARTASEATAAEPARTAARPGWPVMNTPDDMPERPVGAGPSPKPRGSLGDVFSRQSVLVALVVVAALAVLVGVLLNTLGDDSGNPGGRDDTTAGGKPDPGATDASGEPGDRTPSASASDGAGDGDADDKGGDGKGEAGDDKGKGDGEQDSGSLDTTTYRSGQGYTIGLPSGWRYRSTDRAGDRFTGPGDQRLLIGWTTMPEDDAVADWKQLEKTMTRDRYKRIRIEAVDYRGWEAADWEFTYVDGGTKYRTVDRGFVVSPVQGYALMYTAPAADWNGDRREKTWDALTTTFRPKS
ncbi:serine/threonine-protein kinase [Streptomyces sp. MJP52]|uniref:serine/threonine-protein kinase n=1 Tax=Streptomyces sp. MJP52 TaxID=2940555 RepID=UPI002473C0B2|nr:serine/threonine-protein kinase [Streptomyces sp. MJP52]MDH6225473.1 tRNA A-37 threonylcarbamoyl transferase component Bud32 [Streptomyces sp. MJP52]